MAYWHSYSKDNKGLVTTEFAVISFALLMTIFFIVELTLLYFFIQSSQKAAHMGARYAIVSDAAATGLPTVNTLAGGGIFGTPCSEGSCVSFGPLTCTEGTCDAAPFTALVSRMQGFLPGLMPEHVTVSYTYQGLGYAGGPVIPAVTVTISNVPYQTGILGVLMAAGQFNDILPPVSVTLTGEDLSTSGA